MEHAEWTRLCAETTRAMRAHVMPFVTPISRILSEEEGRLEGTGSYLSWQGRVLLVTNEHVARARLEHPLAHQFHGSDEIHRLTEPFFAEEHPVDVAACAIKPEVWAAPGHAAQAIPESRVADRHDPAEGELLFLAGYAGQRSVFSFGHLVSRGTPYLTQQCALPDDPRCDAAFHFALHYWPDQAEVASDERAELPVPPGLSGSLVWDTRRMACLGRGEEWRPELAVVTGIVWGWPSSDACLIATRGENLKDCLGRLAAAS